MLSKHKTRFSDSSLYDEVCVKCGATDANGMDRLNAPCPGVDPREMASAFEKWKQDLPKCLSYEGGCDGDLPPHRHVAKCPLHGKGFATLEDAFKAGRDAALEEAAKVATEEIASFTGPTGGWCDSPKSVAELIAMSIRALKEQK